MDFTMVYQFQNTMVYYGIPDFTMVYQFQNTMVYHGTFS